MSSRLCDEEVRPDYCLFLSQFCIYTIRQVKAICILVGNEDEPFYTEQAGQLLRGLCETWARSAWMIKPDTENERMDRARTIYKDSTAELRNTIDYKAENLPPVMKPLYDLLAARESRIANYEEVYGRVKGLPNTRQICENLGRPDMYLIFRYESSPTHASVLSLGTTTSYTAASEPILGSPNPQDRRAQILLTALDVFEDTACTMIEGLDLDVEGWENTRTPVNGEIYERLLPLLAQA